MQSPRNASGFAYKLSYHPLTRDAMRKRVIWR